MKGSGPLGEKLARRWIEDQGFVVHDANIIFGVNCPNIDLIVYRQFDAIYVQVKTSTKPAGADSILVDGSVWTDAQMNKGAPLFNKHDGFRASFILIVHISKNTQTDFFLVPPESLESMLRPRAKAFANKPKRDGTRRSIRFRKELPRAELLPWLKTASLFE